MKNEYVVSEVVEVGAADSLILDAKGPVFIDDGVGGMSETVAFDE